VRRGLFFLLAVLLGGWLAPTAEALTRTPAVPAPHYDEAVAVVVVVLGDGITMDPYPGDATDPGSLHRYSYCQNDPANRVDPLGLYSIDFHYYVIDYILRSLGYSAADAHNVARWSQYVDDASETEALRVFDFSGNAEQTRADFHFFGSTPTSATVMNDPNARNQLVGATGQFYAAYRPGQQIDQFRAAQLGRWLHTYADTFSHAGFAAWHNDQINGRTGSARPNTGHADATNGGHSPDMISLNQDNHDTAVLAIQNIYDILSQGNPNIAPQSRAQTIARLSGSLFFGGTANTYGAEDVGGRASAARIMTLMDADFGGHTTYNLDEIRNNNTLRAIYRRAIGVHRITLPGVQQVMPVQ
jgi:hypothetical protein